MKFEEQGQGGFALRIVFCLCVKGRRSLLATGALGSG